MADTPKPDKPITREQQAALEVGRTEIRPAQKFMLIASFASLLLAVPVVRTIREIRRGVETPEVVKILGYAADAATVAGGNPYQGPLPIRVTPGGDLWSRAFAANRVMLYGIQRYEDALSETSLLTENLVGPAQYLLTRTAGAGNESAYPGRDGWLFYRPGIDYCTAPGFLTSRHLTARAQSGTEWRRAPQPDPLIAIFQFHAQLQARGIRLVVMPTPIKSVVHPEKFTSRYDDRDRPVQNASYDRMLAELAEPELFFQRMGAYLAPYRDVPEDKARLAWYWPMLQAFDRLQEQRERICQRPVIVFDPAGDMVADKRAGRGEQFLHTDTHWTPGAMEAAARRLAGLLRDRLDVEPGPAGTFQREPIEVENLGDIAAMMQLPAWQDIYRPQRVRIRQVLQGQTLWRPDRNADVLLLGDSFSNIYSLAAMGWGESAGFAEQLSFHLSKPIDAIRRNDAGAHATREMLSGELARGSDRLAGKKVVVWQFAGRELAVGDWRVDSTPMQLGEPVESDLIEIPAGEPREVVGTVLSATPAPRPGSVNYAEHVIHLHIGDVEALGRSGISGRDALVAMYSMRGGEWTPAARYRPGRRVQLRLWNYGQYDRAHKISGLNASVPEGDLMLAEPVWAEDLTEPVSGPEARDLSSWPEIGAVAGVIVAVCLVLALVQRWERKEALA